jgi:hypothetical protein
MEAATYYNLKSHNPADTDRNGTGRSHSHKIKARIVTGARNRMPQVKARWNIRASNPAVCMSSASLTVNTGPSHDLQARHEKSLMVMDAGAEYTIRPSHY